MCDCYSFSPGEKVRLRAVVNIIFFSRKSARGLAHSMTLRAFQKSSCRAQRLGLRWPSPAFPNITATLSHPVSEGQEGESSAVSLKTCDWICRMVIRRTGNMRTLFLLPGGEGQVEGGQNIIFVSRRLLLREAVQRTGAEHQINGVNAHHRPVPE